jgi:rfaE bifunctional protein nucleotidyltransferase chain/domain
MKKILTYKQLPKVVEGYKEQEKRIVLTQGTFDLVHIGHGRYLQEARTYGEVLFVGVDSDEKVRQRKGPERPVVPEQERCEILTYFSSVDHVTVKPLGAEQWSLIKLILPDVLVVTSDTYDEEQLAGLKQYCGEVVVLAPREVTSTSAKIRRVQLKMAEEMARALAGKLSEALEDILVDFKQAAGKKKRNVQK